MSFHQDSSLFQIARNSRTCRSYLDMCDWCKRTFHFYICCNVREKHQVRFATTTTTTTTTTTKILVFSKLPTNVLKPPAASVSISTVSDFLLWKLWRLDFPTFFYNVPTIFPYYGKGPIFPVR